MSQAEIDSGKQRPTEGAQVMTLAVVQEFVELLDADPRHSRAKFGGDPVCGGPGHVAILSV